MVCLNCVLGVIGPVAPYSVLLVLPFLGKLIFWLVGSVIVLFGRGARNRLLSQLRTRNELNSHNLGAEKAERSASGENRNIGLQSPSNWSGIIGFFHPFCAAAGGGERVLWAAVADTQARFPNALCVIYSADAVTASFLATQAQERFNITIQPDRLHLVHIPARLSDLLRPSTWPSFTLLGQSFGSVVVAVYAIATVRPDVFIDTMGFSFGVAACKLFFPAIRTGAYIHYPIISSDMLAKLLNQEKQTFRIRAKAIYWRVFSYVYGLVGGQIDQVVVNSTWTKNHLVRQWGPFRSTGSGPMKVAWEQVNRLFPKREMSPIEILYPPVGVEELAEAIEVSERAEKERMPYIVCISQFRPEKRHELAIRAMAALRDRHGYLGANPTSTSSTTQALSTDHKENTTVPYTSSPTLVLIGSTRNAEDEALVESLRQLVLSLNLVDHVRFVINAPWSAIRSWLASASIGVNAMWNEHFGIGVVEYQAAGLVAVVNDTGGPAEDIVRDVDPAELCASVAGIPDQLKQAVLSPSLQGREGRDGGPSTTTAATVAPGRTGFRAVTKEGYADAFAEVLGMSASERVEIRKRARVNAYRFSTSEFIRGWTPMIERLVLCGDREKGE